MNAARRGVMVVAALALVGCFDKPEPDVAFQCGDEGQCPSGYECRDDGCCHLPGSPETDRCTGLGGADAALIDASPADASTADAAVIDADPPDADPPDADPPDADPPDADPPDATPDATVDAMPALQLTGLSPGTALLTAGDTVDLTLTIDGPAPAGGTSVAISSDAMAVATVPAAVVVLQGDTTATFTVNAIAAGDAVISASLDGTDVTAAITVAAAGAAAGEVTITEVLAIVAGGGNDGELIELRNTTDVTLDLAGWTIAADAVSDTLIAPSLMPAASIYLAPGAVIYGVPNPALPANIPAGAGFVYGAAGTALELPDAGAVLRLNDGTVDVDVVDTTGWLVGSGTPAATQFAAIVDRSTQLDGRLQNATDNDGGAVWCVPSLPTPGADNPSCGGAVINEIHNNPFGADDRAEFIELRVIPGADLSGLRLRATGADGVPAGIDFTVPAGTRAPLDGLHVTADNTGGATTVANADMSTAFGGLPDSDGALQVIGADGALADAVGYGTLSAAVDTVDGFAILEAAATVAAEGSSVARDSASTDTDDNSADMHLDPSPTPGLINDTVVASLSLVSPDNGLATVGATVVLSGSEFVVGALVTVYGIPATCTVTSATSIDCTFPAHALGAEQVDVAVTNPGAAEVTLAGGFTFTGVLPDPGPGFFCNVQFPAATTTTAGVATESIFGQVFVSGLTDANASAAPGITADLGYGADGVDPTAVNFSWRAAAANSGFDFTGNNDEFVGTLTVGATGSYDYAYRFSLDGGLNFYYCDSSSDDGYAPANAGALTVN